MPFDPRSLIAALPPFDSSTPAAFDGYTQYCQLYRLQFGSLCVSHHLGQLSIEDHTIAVQLFRAPAPQGTLLIVHGYLDHQGLYRHIIRYALQRHLNVVSFDLPGHGLSSGQRAAIDSFDHYQPVLAALLQQITHWQLTQPLHLVGQSTGAAIINQYLLSPASSGQPPSVEGDIILLAPLLRAARWRWVSLAHRLLSPWKNSLKRDFAPNSHDPQFNAFLPTDPLQSATISADWVGALKRWIPQFMALPGRSDIQPLIIQGQQDATVDWRYNLTVLTQKFPQQRQLEIANGRHQLANESQPIRDRYFDWLDQQGFSQRSETEDAATTDR